MKNYFLWLPSWYPNTLSLYDGDFIQRHAKAAATFEKIVVLYVKKDTDGIITKNKKEVINEFNNLTEIIIYYHPKKTAFPLINKAISFFKYYNIYFKALRNVVADFGKPRLIHAHVLLEVAIQALWFHKKYKTPIIVSEHWSGFITKGTESIEDVFFLKRFFISRAFKKSKFVITVSDVLGKNIRKIFKINHYQIIPNVVDTSIFYPVEKEINKVPTFIHVSNGTALKNIPLIIEAFELIKNQGHDFILQLIVPNKKEVAELISKHQLNDYSIIHEEAPQMLIANYMRQSDAIILFSSFETFGCVVIEANACGIPAILSELAVFKEYGIENETALYAEKDNKHELAQSIIQFINNKNNFNKKNISERTHHLFSFNAVGKQFEALYKNLY